MGEGIFIYNIQYFKHMSKVKKYKFNQRILIKETINCIKRTISDNENINVKKLIAILHVNPPYISKDKSMQYIEDMKRSGQIDINKKEEVTLCHS